MAATQNLIWDDYSKDIESGLCEIFRTGILHDVTLMAEGEKITAHKLVLALSSVYFKNLFSDDFSPGQRAMVFITEISFRALKALVEFMYTGEITIPQDLLEEVLKGAKILNVQALIPKEGATNNEQPEDKESPISENTRRMKRISRVPFRYQYETKTKKQKLEEMETKSILSVDLNGVTDANNEAPDNNVLYENDPIALPGGLDMLDLDASDKFDDIESTDADTLDTLENNEQEPEDTKDNITLLSSTSSAPTRLKYIRNKNGNFCLVLNDHIFLKQTLHKNKIFWRCQMHSKLGCKSRCVTQGNTIVKKIAVHSHAPQTDKVIECEINGEIVYM